MSKRARTCSSAEASEAPQCKFIREEIDVYHDLTYDVSIENTNQSIYYPLHSCENKSAPLIFNITGNDVNHLNTAESHLYIRAKIVDKHGKDVPYEADKAKSSYALINLGLMSLFSSVEIKVNDTEAQKSTKWYAEKCMFETLLGKGKDWKKSFGAASGYFRSKDENDTNDQSYVSRTNMVDKSRVFELMGRPHLNLLNQTRFLPPMTDVKLEFHRSSDAYCIQTKGTHPPENIQVQILEAEFIINKHIIHKKTWEDQYRRWIGGHPLIYPMRDAEMKSYNLAVGLRQDFNETTILGYLPDKVVIALCDAKSLHGSYDTNPHIYMSHGLSAINLTVNSDVTTVQNIECDYDDNRSLKAYSALFENLGFANCDSGLEMTKDEFTKSKSLFVFDLRHMRNAAATPRHGNCVINLRFKEALKKALTVLVYLDYQSVMYLHSNRRVQFKEYTR